jgi:hypothetical protein
MDCRSDFGFLIRRIQEWISLHQTLKESGRSSTEVTMLQTHDTRQILLLTDIEINILIRTRKGGKRYKQARQSNRDQKTNHSPDAEKKRKRGRREDEKMRQPTTRGKNRKKKKKSKPCSNEEIITV